MRTQRGAAFVLVATTVAGLGCDGRIATRSVVADAGAPDAANSAAVADDAGPPPNPFRDIALGVYGLDLTLDESSIYVVAVDGQVTRVDKTTGAAQPLVAVPNPTGEPFAGFPRTIALCGDSVVWTEYVAGRIVRVAKSGGDLEEVRSGLHRPWGVACDATNIYWAEEGTPNGTSFDGVIASAPLVGGERVILADQQPWATDAVALTDDAVVFASNVADHVQIRRVAKTGGAVTILSAPSGGTFHLEVHGDRVLWSSTDGAYWVPISGGPARKVDVWPAANLTFTGEHLFYEMHRYNEPVYFDSQPPEGSPPTKIGQTTVSGMMTYYAAGAASDASGAYLMDVGAGDGTNPGYHTIIHVLGR